jgi:hypothetical protein
MQSGPLSSHLLQEQCGNIRIQKSLQYTLHTDIIWCFCMLSSSDCTAEQE